ncbi:MAG: hypothetical protein JXB14_00355 [Candidatus Altiarchaeota archaeon]|nr:hypothetical protein [Candidatus Altiarchaeota archaeon]
MARRRRPSIDSAKRGGHGGLIVGLIVIILLVAVGYLLFGGDKGTTPPVTNGVSSAEVLSKAIDATGKANSQSFTIQGSVAMSTRGNNIPILMSGDGELDTNQKRMRIKIDVTLPPTPLSAETKQSVETYVIGNTLYTFDGTTWRKTTSSTDLWGERQAPQRLIDFLTGTRSELLGSENIAGKDAYKIAIKPTVRELLDELSGLQPMGSSLPALTENNIAEIENSVRAMGITMWVEKGTYYPIRVDMNLGFEFTEGTQKLNVDIKMSLSTLYNVPVSVNLPMAAETAIDSGVSGF